MRRTSIWVGTAVVVWGLWAANPARAGQIFFDNFNYGASPLWGNEVGSWTTANGGYYAQDPNNNPTTYTSLPFQLHDFSMEMDIRGVSDGGVYIHSDGN